MGFASGTGIRVEDDFAHACKVQDRRIVEWWMYGPVEEALEALEAVAALGGRPA